MDDQRQPLTESERAGLDAMLAPLQRRVAGAARARRFRRRAVGAVAVMALVAVVATFALRAPTPPTPTLAPPIAKRTAPLQIEYVQTDPTSVERIAVTGAVDLSAYTIDDTQLLDTLASIDRPAGLVRTAEGVSLTRPVTDLELGSDG